MTLQQMRYVIMVAEKKSFGKAAIELFISQPSLSNAIHSLEVELGIELFIRTSKGVLVSPEGQGFVEAAKRIVMQADAVLSQYTADTPTSQVYFSVSSLRYGFSVRAFSRLLDTVVDEHYDMSFRDAQLTQIVQDVATQHSEIGVLHLSTSNSKHACTLFKKNQLIFTSLFSTVPHVLLREGHPLTQKDFIRLDDLAPYPLIYYDHDPNSCSDQPLFSVLMPKSRLRGEDRSTLISLLQTTDGYSIGNGILDKIIYSGLVAIPLTDITEQIEIGWIKRGDSPLSVMATQYLENLKKEIAYALDKQ